MKNHNQNDSNNIENTQNIIKMQKKGVSPDKDLTKMDKNNLDNNNYKRFKEKQKNKNIIIFNSFGRFRRNIFVD